MADSRKRRFISNADESAGKKKFEIGSLTGHRFLIPSKAAGAMIGKGGEVIKRLRSEHNYRIIIPDSQGPERLVIIDAPPNVVINVWTGALPSLKEYMNAKECDYKGSSSKYIDGEAKRRRPDEPTRCRPPQEGVRPCGRGSVRFRRLRGARPRPTSTRAIRGARNCTAKGRVALRADRNRGSELVQKFVGEGARMVRELFVMAREHSPSIIFMDEVDSIGSTRLDSGSGGDSRVQRTMLGLLDRLDGFEPTQSIEIIMATNRIDFLDSALLRPGRIDRKIEFPAPNQEARLDKLKARIGLASVKYVERVHLPDDDSNDEGDSGVFQICYSEEGEGASRGMHRILHVLSGDSDERDDWVQLLRFYAKESGALFRPRFHPSIWQRPGKYSCCGDTSRHSMGCELTELFFVGLIVVVDGGVGFGMFSGLFLSRCCCASVLVDFWIIL